MPGDDARGGALRVPLRRPGRRVRAAVRQPRAAAQHTPRSVSWTWPTRSWSSRPTAAGGRRSSAPSPTAAPGRPQPPGELDRDPGAAADHGGGAPLV